MPDLNVSLSQGNPITVSVNGSGAATATVTAGGTANVTVTGAIPNPGAGTVIVSSGGIADLTSTQQAAISQGVVVVTTDGYRFIYSGAGSKVDQASYVLLSDTTPTWASIEGKPTTDGITEGTSNLYHTTGRAAAAAPVQSVAGRTGAVTLAVADVTGAVGTTDARLSDAREWSADTVSQAEAEAGTATTRRAFTALRVFQAVAAWWHASAAKAKLDGIASGATANATDAQLRDRSTHTGTQGVATVSGLQAALDSKASINGTPVFSTLQVGAGSQSGGLFTVDIAGRVTAGEWTASVITVARGGTGANTAQGARASLGVDYGTTSSTVCVGNDARLSDARTPTAHKNSHATGGADALAPADIGAAAATHTHSASDITSGTIATARLGSGTADATTYLRGDQTWATVSGESFHPFLLAGM